MKTWAGVLLVGWVLWMGQPHQDGSHTWTRLQQFPEPSHAMGPKSAEVCESFRVAVAGSTPAKRARFVCAPEGLAPQ